MELHAFVQITYVDIACAALIQQHACTCHVFESLIVVIHGDMVGPWSEANGQTQESSWISDGSERSRCGS